MKPLNWFNLKRRRVENPFTGLTLPLFCACPNPWPCDFQWHSAVVFFCVQCFEMRGWCLFSVGGIVDHQCLNFLSITLIVLEWSVAAISITKLMFYPRWPPMDIVLYFNPIWHVLNYPQKDIEVIQAKLYIPSPWNENLNWLVQIKFLNLFYIYMYI